MRKEQKNKLEPERTGLWKFIEKLDLKNSEKGEKRPKLLVSA